MGQLVTLQVVLDDKALDPVLKLPGQKVLTVPGVNLKADSVPNLSKG